jgi:phage tail sheath protein FI
MRLYYANGGGHCFVVSVGDYSSGAKKADFLSGLSSLANQVGPTILVIPSACLLNEDEYADVVQAMLTQCEQLQDRVAIIDVRGGDKIQPDGLDILINGAAPKKGFRDYVKGEQNQLSYGMAYFPFLFTSIVQPNELGLRNLNDASRALTKKWLTEELPKQYPNVSAGKGAELAAELGIIDQVKDGDIIAPGVTDIAIQLSNNLLAAFPQLGQLYEVMAKKLNVLPPSGAMAGVYAAVDKTRGVWNAPANITLNAVVGPTVKISGDEQDDLNVPVGGKAVNVIREFVGRGTLVWGARTLNGNSSDWRYIQVRRTMIYVQQSIKAALQPYVFAANDGKTWSTVTAMISNFLQTLWSQGGLMGDKASEAFTVHCGLGTTMTGQDILDGYMIVQVSLQMIHPAEFIEVTFKQQMQGVA